MSKKYYIECDNCVDEKMWEKRGDTIHYVDEGQKVFVVDTLYFLCEKCKSIAYRKSIGMNDILADAVEKGYNTVVFEQGDINYGVEENQDDYE